MRFRPAALRIEASRMIARPMINATTGLASRAGTRSTCVVDSTRIAGVTLGREIRVDVDARVAVSIQLE